jgi:hypothetical protein
MTSNHDRFKIINEYNFLISIFVIKYHKEPQKTLKTAYLKNDWLIFQA